MNRALSAIHPGEILREEFLKPMDISAGFVANACGVPRSRIERLVKELTPITADTALRLGAFFGTTAQFWLNMQAQYELESANRKAIIKGIKPFIQLAAAQ